MKPTTRRNNQLARAASKNLLQELHIGEYDPSMEAGDGKIKTGTFRIGLVNAYAQTLQAV